MRVAVHQILVHNWFFILNVHITVVSEVLSTDMEVDTFFLEMKLLLKMQIMWCTTYLTGTAY